ncbi:MAG: Gfo/Idh/MocA family protein [Planctomycetota bacterium]
METLRIGILGCGGHAGAHARRYRDRDDVAIVALCDRDPDQIASLVARRLDSYSPAPARFTDPTQMYREAALDAVSILTPHHLHAEHIIQALEAGCHVLVEKPMVASTDEAAAVHAAATAHGKHVLTCFNPPFTDAVAAVRRAVADGSLGELRLVNAWLTQDWRRLTAGSWRQQAAISCGGQCGDSGAHLLAGLCWAVGVAPEQVYARLERRGTEVPIDGALLIDFPGGVHATVAIGGDSAHDGSHAVFAFTDGHIEVDLWRGSWHRVVDGQDPGERQEGSESDPNAHFLDVVAGRAPALITITDAMVQAALLQAMVASDESGQPQAITVPD